MPLMLSLGCKSSGLDQQQACMHVDARLFCAPSVLLLISLLHIAALDA